MNRRLLPHPLLSLTVVLLWAVISNAASSGLLLLGGLLAFVVPLLTRPFWPAPPRLIRPWLALRFCAVFAADVFTANWRVAWRVIGPLHRLSPAFVEVPLEIHDPFLATLLASVVSLTPGPVAISEGLPALLDIFDLSKYPNLDKRKALRNCVRPELGLHILNESKFDIHQELFI